MTTSGKIQQALSVKIERDLILVVILSALLIGVIAFLRDSPARIILGLPFTLFFPGYVLISALFPRKEGLDITERLALSFGLSIAVTPLIGLIVNYTPFGIRLYPVTFSLFLLIFLMSLLAMLRRKIVSPQDVFAPLARISVSTWFEAVKSRFGESGTESRVIKIVAIIALGFIILALIIVSNSPATGYEPSIYTATPPIFWAGLIFSSVCGIGIIVQQVYAREHEKSNLWVVGLILILLSYTAFLSLWIIRGYALWCPGDPLSHLGTIQNAITSGHIEPGNIYPVTHIYLAVTSSISGIPVIILHKYVPLIFGLLFVAFMYLFARSILPEKGQVILATVVSLIPLHGSYLNLTPNHLSNLALPLAFFLLIKSFSPGTVQWKTLFTVMVFLFPIFHPLPGFILLLMLLTIWLPGRTLSILRKEASKARSSAFGFNTTAALLLFVWGITWISSFYVWEATIRNVYTLITEGGPVHLSLLREQILLAGGYGYSVAEQFFKVYGGIVALILLTMVALPILWRRTSTEANLRNLFSLYGPLATFALAIVLLYFLNIGFGPLRLLVYVVIICTIFTGFMLYEILERARSWHKSNYAHRLAPLLVVVIVIAVFINGGLKLYPSPYILGANWQITRTEITGMDWFFHNKDIATPITGMTISPGRFADFILTPEEGRQHKHLPLHLTEELQLPWHFGYDEHLQLGEAYAQNTYLVLNTAGRLLYVEVLPEIAEIRFLPADFDKLEQDLSMDKLYSNGGLDVYYIHARASPT